jgi:hypothetical protein
MTRSIYTPDLATLVAKAVAAELAKLNVASKTYDKPKRTQPPQLARYQQQRARQLPRRVVVNHTATAMATAQPASKPKAVKPRVFDLTAEEFQQSLKNRDLTMVEVQQFLVDNAPELIPHTVVRGRWLWYVGPKPTDNQRWTLKYIGFKAVNYKKYGRGWEWGHRCGVQKRNFRPVDPEQVHGHTPLA